MKSISKTFSKHKKSIFSLVLAFLLTLTFNYSPISVLVSTFTSAYKAESKSTYYSASATGEETKISDGQMPDSIADYFEGSKENFNIKKDFYDPEFESTFGYEVNRFFKNFSDAAFLENYNKFLQNKGYESKDDGIYSYYTANKQSIPEKSFRDYIESFVSKQSTYDNGNIVINPIFSAETYKDYKSRFYCSLANFINNEVVELTDNDGVEEGKDFYETSISYGRVKKAIDNIIDDVLAIYGYDGKTQNKYVASILANGAPISTSSYYHATDKYYTTIFPDVTYETDTNSGLINVYYFGDESVVPDSFKTATNYKYKHQDLSVRDNSILFFKEITADDEIGYDTNFKTYYRFNSTIKKPYLTTDGYDNIYVLNNNPSENESATYNALGFTTITSDDIANNKEFFVKIPYYSDDLAYFDAVINSNILTLLGNSKDKFYELFTTTDGLGQKDSIIYFKFSPKSAQRNIYYDEATVGNVDNLKTGYKYKDLLQTAVPNIADNPDYELITSGTYYDSNYRLYFRRNKIDYGKTVSTYGSEFEMKTKPNIPIEQHQIPSNLYELSAGKKDVYVLADTGFTATDGTVCKPLSQQTLDESIANLYIKVPASVQEKLNNGQAESYVFYYKHSLTEKINKIYVLDDKNTNPDVYKNLHYTVIKSSDYLSDDMSKNYSNYVLIPKTDSNYNENMKLYYKYDNTVSHEDIYVQNVITGMNARYIIDSNGIDSNERPVYQAKGLTVITQTEFDSNPEFYKQIDETDKDYYDPQNTKLYFKYKSVETDEREIYLYSSKTSSIYKTFYSSSTDYDANDYVLIEPGQAGYVDGTDLYYKKIRTGSTFVAEEQKSYFYYYTTSTGSSAKLLKDSFYVISFYVYTNGYYDTDDVTETGTLPIEASVYITDTNGKFDEIAVEGIKTKGTWKQYFVFLATDELADSAYKISFYLGNKNSILGSNVSSAITNVTGNILFDNIQIYKINETEFNNKTINGNYVQDPEKPLKESTAENAAVIPGKFADEFNNEVIIVNNDPVLAGTNDFDARTKTEVALYDANMFNFDSLGATMSGLTFVDGTTGYTPYASTWQHYISRTDSDPGNETSLKIYQKAYKDGNLSASIIDEKDFFDDKKTAEEAKEDTDDKSTTTDEAEKLYVEHTFEEDNKVLKLENNHNFLDLGITSNTFTIKQFQYYKLTVWVYSTDKDAQAIVTINSVYDTNGSGVYGNLMTTTATVDANVFDYTNNPTNEYGWIPINIYISGNALHDQDCTLVLSASENSTVYFDKITIQNTTSDSVSSATYSLSLTDSSAVLEKGITNGYFNNVNVTTDYKDYDYTLPKVAKNWTYPSTNPTNVIAGVIPTNAEYVALPKNFFTKYNGGAVVTNKYGTNIFAINAPETKTDSNVTGKDYKTRSTYSFYTSKQSLSAGKVFKIEAEFYYTENNFKGTMFANIYAENVATDKIIARIALNETELTPNAWNVVTFYIQTGSGSSNVYFELGIENAVGTCFFQKAIREEQTKSLNTIRDELYEKADITADDKTQVPESVLRTTKFINFNEIDSSILSPNKNEFDLFDTKEYKSDVSNTSTYTVGKSGVAVASYYTSSEESSYTVTINKVEYYIAAAVDSNGDFILDEDDNKIYKLYSDSNHKDEVTEIDGRAVTVNGTKSVTLGTGKSASETNLTETKKTNYIYHFDKDVEINNTFIPASELNNAQSQNVLILANNYNTDYTIQTPIYTNSLSTSSYYVLKIYVKTSDFESDDFGLNIEIPSISTSWTNINTTKIAEDNVQKVENGFVCYQVLLTTNTSSIASLAVNFSLGTTKSTGTGYAIISGVQVEKFATEKLFNEYTESEKVSDDENVMKKFFGAVKTEEEKKEETKAVEDEKMSWATFFYIFSSLLLVIALAVALVSIILKKHPIKIVKQVENDHERNMSPIATAKRNSNDVIEVTKATRKSKSVKKQTSDADSQDDDSDTPVSNSDEGFI